MSAFNWRSEYPILVPNSHAVGMVAVIRSLGRAGYPVHATAVRSDAVGLKSRFAVAAAISPPYSNPEFLPWLRDYVARYRIRGIAPVGVLMPARPHFEEFRPLLPIHRDPGIVYRAVSKYEVSRLLATPVINSKASENLPPSLLLRDGQTPTEADLQLLGMPIFLKTDAIHSVTSKGSEVVRANSAAQGLRIIDGFWKDFDRISIQGFVPGLGAAAAFVVWGGRVHSQYMNLCVHESPHTGGLCSLRDSWLHNAILEDALIKIREIGWEGISMLEYRWDPATDRFYFIEINPRFWAAMHTALYAGMDMPRILFDVFFGRLTAPELVWHSGVRTRLTFPFEVGHVLSRLRDRAVPFSGRLWSILEFFLLFLDVRVKSDFFYPGDRMLYFYQLWNMIKEDLRRFR